MLINIKWLYTNIRCFVLIDCTTSKRVNVCLKENLLFGFKLIVICCLCFGGLVIAVAGEVLTRCLSY